MTNPLSSLLEFKLWVEANGYSYLAKGVGGMLATEAVMEIARRAGVRGLKGSDSVAQTLPMIQDLIRLRCKARHDHSPS